MASAAQSRHLVRSALDLVQSGMAVFPLQPGTEVPVRNVDWQRHATRDPEAVRHWWRIAPFNIGVLTGLPSSVLVVGLRAPRRIGLPHGLQVLTELAHGAGVEIPTDTRAVMTPRGDHHLYFRFLDGAQLGSIDGGLGTHVDVRGTGGYVVGPGSVVSGRQCKVVCAADPQPVPAWLLAHLQRQPIHPARTRSSAATQKASDYVSAVVRTQAERVARAPAGARREILFRAAASLGRLVADQRLTETMARSALSTACNEHQGVGTLSPHVIEGTIRSGLRHSPRSRSASSLTRHLQQADRRGG